MCGWSLPLFHAHRDTDIQWAFPDGPLVELAKAQAPDFLAYEIPSWKILRTAEYRRDLYSVALFDRTSAD